MAVSISWGTVKSLIFFFGPLLLPKLIGFYRRTRAAPRAAGLAVAPLPPSVRRTVQLLLAVAIVFLVASLPILQPENIFHETESRLQIPTDTLFARVATLRPDQKLTPTDEALKSKFVNMESRYLYAAYGPDAVANCLFCTLEDPKSFMFYMIPDLLAPHLVNLVVIGVATSTLLSASAAAATGSPTTPQGGSAAAATSSKHPPARPVSTDNTSTRIKKAAPRWRYTASLAATILMALDIYFLYSLDPVAANKSAKRLSDVVFFSAVVRTCRFVALGTLDLALALLVFLSGTNRAFVVGGLSAAERVTDAARALQGAKSKLSAAGIVKNAAARDERLRRRGEEYWARETEVMGEVMQEPEVLEGVNDALAGRLNMGNIQRDAEMYSDSLFRPILVQQAMALGRQELRNQQQQQQQQQQQSVPTPIVESDGEKKTK